MEKAATFGSLIGGSSPLVEHSVIGYTFSSGPRNLDAKVEQSVPEIQWEMRATHSPPAWDRRNKIVLLAQYPASKRLSDPCIVYGPHKLAQIHDKEKFKGI